jgi:ligand-binding sensor domain-containing protein/signal transduction histidine kinase
MRLLLRNSNTSPDRRAKLRWPCKWIWAVLAFVWFANLTNASGASKGLSQYIRNQWGAEQGFPGGPVFAIVQTPDGYLWIGTERGLIRFDGLSFRLFQHADATPLPDGAVHGLAVDAEGDLWIRLQGPRLLRYRDGTFRDVIPNLGLAEADVTAMCAGKNGDILFSGFANGIVRYSKGKFVPLAASADLPRLVISMAETDDGKVWMGTREQGLYYLKNGQVSSITSGLPDKKINSLLAIDSHDLWIGTDNGVGHWNGTEFTPAAGSRVLEHVQGLVMMKDRESNVWVGSPEGLFRLSPAEVSSPEESEEQSAGAVKALFEDREGNVWIGTTQGLERLRHTEFTTYSRSAGLPSDTNGPLHADSGGRTWFAPMQGGLYWLREGQVGKVDNAGLDGDVIYSIAGRKDELWVGRQRGGLTHLRADGASFTSETYTQTEGLAQNSVYAVHQNRDSSVWAGTLSAGVSNFRNGKFITYTTQNGLASNTIASIAEGSDGTMWFGTPNGLNALSNGQWRVYTSREGLPPGTVNCLLLDSAGLLWIGTSNGLAFFDSGIVRTLPEEPASLHEQILGIEEDKTGSLWIVTSNHVLRAKREKLLSLTLSGADVREYGIADGLQSVEGVKRYRSVVAGTHGRIWMSTTRGISVIDPTQTMGSSAPALVHIEEISADGRRFNMGEQVRVLTPPQRITLTYSGLSLAVPARVRFKYKLDGFDPAWSDPTTAREASYTNLGSGPYRFRVIASNSDGLWNSSESTLQFEIDPVFWQTWWFRISSVLALGLAVLMYFRLRVLRLTSQMNMRFEERLAERTRIAQELHDTLLQGFLSASMQLHVAEEHLPADSPAKPLVGRVLELMGQVIEEGRDALRGLRSSKLGSSDLEQAFSQIRQEFPVQTQIGFRVIVEGTPRPLRSVIRDEVYLIGHEALSNAFRHAHASEIEVELEYTASHLRVFVRDNGGGIDTQVLFSGRDGHWGLSGMKERTERIGGKLRVLSRAIAGTEVELSVPGHIAFKFPGSDRRRGWLSRLVLRKGRELEPKGDSENHR